MFALWIAACRWGSPEPPAETEASEATEAPGVTDEWLAAAFVAEAGKQAPSLTLTQTGPLTFVAETPDGSVTPLDLANLRGECGERREVCQVAVQTWVRAVSSTPGEAAFAAENLRLVLQSRQGVAAAQPQAVEWGRPFAGDLMVFLVADQPDTILTLNPTDRAALKMDDAAIEAAAMANMRQALLPLRFERFHPTAPIWILDTALPDSGAPDSYGAARLILHDAWEAVGNEVKGDLLAAAPARDIAIFTGTDEEKGPEVIEFLAGAMFQKEPHPVSPQVVKWTAEGWVPFGR